MDFAKLKPREQLVVAGLIAALVFGVYMKVINDPVTKKVASYHSRTTRAKAQLSDLKSKFPLTSGGKEKIETLNSECEKLKGRIHELEKKLPPRKEISQLIGEFTRLAKDAKLLAIRQRTVLQAGFNHVFIEVKLDSSYVNAIQYISKIESISPFLRVEEIDINESKGKTVSEGGTPVRVVISSLLGEAPLDEKLKADDAAAPLNVTRDILVSSAKPVVEIDDKEFSLNGITFNSETPTAIINGDVMKVDSTIKGLKVKKILPDSVILTDGVQDHLLSMKR